MIFFSYIPKQYIFLLLSDKKLTLIYNTLIYIKIYTFVMKGAYLASLSIGLL